MPLYVRPRMERHLHIRPSRSYNRPSPRNRVLYAGLVLAVIAAGLLWRSSFMPLPQWLSNNGGDALWALMVFVGFGFLMPRASTLMVALLALTFAWSIEFSQLYHHQRRPPCNLHASAYSAAMSKPMSTPGSMILKPAYSRHSR